MGAKEGVELTEYPSMIRVDGMGLLDFDYEELTDALGSEFDGSVFEEISSTHYGRMVHLDDKTILFASPGGRRRVHRLRPDRALKASPPRRPVRLGGPRTGAHPEQL